jgi:DNA-binding NtrC family response regulator
MEDFDIIGPNDQPALLAVTASDIRAAAKNTLMEMGYKVHSVDDDTQFDARYSQINYQVVVIDENFAGGTLQDNPTLRLFQNLPMSQRRTAVAFLLGASFDTLNTLQAFAQSVHCVINYAQLPMLQNLVQKTVAENELFLTTFREVQRRIYQKA